MEDHYDNLPVVLRHQVEHILVEEALLRSPSSEGFREVLHLALEKLREPQQIDLVLRGKPAKPECGDLLHELHRDPTDAGKVRDLCEKTLELPREKP